MGGINTDIICQQVTKWLYFIIVTFFYVWLCDYVITENVPRE
jgi:hypothetical protein